MMLLQPVLEVEIFNLKGIYGPLPNSFKNQYILVIVNYVFKSVEAVATKLKDNNDVVKF